VIRFAILGAARIGPPALFQPAAAHPDVEVVAVASSDRDKALAYAAANHIPRVADSYRALIEAPDVDVIYNALPPASHAAWSIAALRAGKHVLCEKPFAMNATEARGMVDAAREAGRHLVEAFHYRFHPFFRRAVQLLDSNVVGPLCHIDAVFDAHLPSREGELRYMPELGGGALMDLGCYPANALHVLGGGAPWRVATAECAAAPSGVDLTTSAELRLDSGLTASLYCSMARPTRGDHDTRITITGERGRLILENFVAPHQGNCIRIERDDGTVLDETAEHRTTYSHQLQHFAALVAGKEAPVTGGEDSIATMSIIDAIYASAGFERRSSPTVWTSC